MHHMIFNIIILNIFKYQIGARVTRYLI